MSDVSPAAGTLTTGKHNRYGRPLDSHSFDLRSCMFYRMILANTEELHDKIEELLDRVRLLEDALRTLQASVSTQHHPLLAHLPVDTPSPTISAPPRQLDREDREAREVETSQSIEVPCTPDADDGPALDALGESMSAVVGSCKLC